MSDKNYLKIVVKLRRGSAGLPRRKVCIRSVHHIFRVNDGDSEADDEPDCKRREPPRRFAS